MLPPRIILPLVALLALALLVACRQEEQPQLVPTVAATATAEPLPSATARPTLEPAATATAVEPTLVPTAEPAAATPEPTAAPDDSGLPPASFYDLGPATIIQSHFPADSPFHNMPVQLNVVIAAPPAGGRWFWRLGFSGWIWEASLGDLGWIWDDDFGEWGGGAVGGVRRWFWRCRVIWRQCFSP